MEQAKHKFNLVDHIEVRGARVHNLKNIDINVPLHKIVGIAGVSGSGKSSLALGVLYAGLAAVFGVAFHLHAPPYDAGGTGAGGRSSICPGRARTAPAPQCPGHPQHIRHGHGVTQQPAPDVFAPCKPPLPERALHSADIGRRGGSAVRVPRLRCGIFRAVRGGTRVQQPRRVPQM